MDSGKRTAAHKTYQRLNQTRKPAKRTHTPAKLPKKEPSHAERASRRAADAAFENAGLTTNAAPAGEAKIDQLLREDRQKPVKQKKKFIPVDVPFFMLVFGLLCFGLIMMYSASYAWSIHDTGTPYRYIRQQLICAGLGLGAMVFLSIYDYTRMKKWTVLYYLFAVTLLLLVVFIGRTSNGAKRWLQIGSITFQPSEFAKLAVIWMLAWLYSNIGKRVRRFWWMVAALIGTLLPVVGLIFVEKHISAILLICVTAGVMTFFAGARIWHLAAILVGGGGLLGLFAKLSGKFGYITARFSVWHDPFIDPQGTGYQTIQSLYAIASGGLFGLGLGQSRQKQLYLPEAHNDYVFSVVCEELGLVGAVLVLILFTALIVRGYWIAMHAADRFGSLLAGGITTLIAMQTMMNIAVVTNAIPVTGVSLPFFSYGGTSLVLLLAEMGIVLSVSKQMRTDRV